MLRKCHQRPKDSLPPFCNWVVGELLFEYVTVVVLNIYYNFCAVLTLKIYVDIH